MSDPVILTESGQTYERSAIQQWLYRGHRTDPLTRQQISSTSLSTNWALKNIITAYHSSAPSTPAPPHAPPPGLSPPPPAPGTPDPSPSTPTTPPTHPSHTHSTPAPISSPPCPAPSSSTPSSAPPSPSTPNTHPPSPPTTPTSGPQPRHQTPVAASTSPAHPPSPHPTAAPPAQVALPPPQPTFCETLVLAAARGDIPTIQRLLHQWPHCAPPNPPATQHQPLSHPAPSSAVVQQLPCSSLQETAASALHAAASNGHSRAVEVLLLSGTCRCDTHCRQFGTMPLHTAALCGWHQVVEVLIAYGADTHARDRDLSRTPLHVAAAMGHDNVLRTLLSRGALLDTADRNCATALILAVKAGHASSVALLAAAGADWSVADHSGMTALHHACKAGSEEVVRTLLQHGCDPNMPEHEAATLTPLSLATAFAGPGVMRALLEAGADIDHVDCEQRNALLRAIHRTASSPAPLQLLVDMGADVSVLARLGRDMRLPHLAVALPIVLQAQRGGRGLLHTNPEVEWNPLVDAVMQRDVHAVRLVLSLHGSRAYGPALAAAAVAAFRAGDAAVVAALLPTDASVAELAQSELVTRSLEAVEDHAVMEVLRQRGVLQLCRSMGVVVPLHQHSEAGRVDIIRTLVAAGVADVHAQSGRDMCTALFHCASASTAEALLAVGAHVDARDAVGRTPLMVCKGVDVVRVLLARGGASAAVDADGRNALHAAASCGEYSKLRALLQHDRAAAAALVTAADHSGSLPLHAALRAPQGCVECIDELLAADPSAAATVNARDAEGRTPLLLAVEAQRHSAVRYLAVHGADVGARDARMRNAAGAAALALDLRMLRFILQCGGQLDAEVAADCLVKAVEEGEEGVALLLLERLGSAEVDDRLLLAEACLVPMPRLVAKLLECGADPDEADDEGLTVLHELCEAAAVEGPDLECIDLLLKAGASPHLSRDDDGSTPLHLAAASGNLALLQALLPHAPPSAHWALDSTGATPLLLSAAHGHPSLTCAILSHLTTLQTRAPVPPNPASPAPRPTPHSIAALVNIPSTPSHRAALHHMVLLSNPLLPQPPPPSTLTAIRALLNLGADPSLPDAYANCALHYAAASSAPSLRALLPYATQLNPLNTSSMTPLQLAADVNTPQGWAAAAALLAAGAAAQPPPTAAGSTLLHLAAAHPAGYPAVRELLRLGVDPSVRDAQGRLPADLAAAAGAYEGLRALEAHCAMMVQ